MAMWRTVRPPPEAGGVLNELTLEERLVPDIHCFTKIFEVFARER
jgi:hypothetical protein